MTILEDIGESDSYLRAQNRAGTSKLLAALIAAHTPDTPQPVAIEIKVDEGARVQALECQVDELQAVVGKQREIIRRLADEDALARPRIADIIDVVCKFYHVSKPSVTGQTRTAKITLPRHVICFLCREMTGVSLPDIGRKLGDRDHTSILHGVRRIEDLLTSDEILRDDIDVLKTKIDARVFDRKLVAAGVAA